MDSNDLLSWYRKAVKESLEDIERYLQNGVSHVNVNRSNHSAAARVKEHQSLIRVSTIYETRNLQYR